MPKATRPSPTAMSRLRHGLRRARQRVHDWRKQLPAPVKRILRRTTLWSANTVVVLALAFALVVVGAHLWLPTLSERKADIEQYLGKAIGNPVRVDELGTFWDGLNPGVHVQGFRVQSAATGETAVQLKAVRLALAWWPLLTGRIEIRSLLLAEPNLAVERLPDGRLHIAGLELYQAGDAAQQDFGAWLFRQQELAITNGELLWVDRQGPGEPERVVVRGVNAVLRNDGDRHRLDLHARFPETLCGDCRLSADIVGQPLAGPDWRGEVRIEARALAVNGLPRALRAQLPEELDGRFDVRLTSRWRQGRPLAVEGMGEAKQVVLPLPAGQPTLRFRNLAAAFKWRADGAAWRLELDRLRLGLTRDPWLAGTVRIDSRPESLRLAVDHVEVGDLAAFAAATDDEGRFLRWLRAARPEGALDRLEVDLIGRPDVPTDYRIEARLRDWQFAAHERIPGVRGLSGRLRATRSGGEFQLDSRAVQLDVPRVLPKAHDIARLASRIRWRQNPEDWFVRAEDIELVSRAGQVSGEMELRLPHDPEVSPVIKLRLTGRDGDGSYTADFIPLVLPDKLRAYLAEAVVGGRVTTASVILHGALRNFPFRDGKGRFEVRAHVKNGIYEYLPGWAPLRDVEADLYFTGREMLITASHAEIRNVPAGRLVAAIDDFKAPDGAVLTVRGRAAGPLDGTLGLLADSGSPRLSAWIVPGMHAEGDGVMHLDLRIPLRTLADFDLAGEYRLAGNHLEFPVRSLRVEDLRGVLAFNRSGLRTARVDGRFLGGESVLEARPAADGHTRVELRGRLTAPGLAQALGPQLSSYLDGEVPWQAALDLRPDASDWNVALDLGRFEIRLPAPLAKARDEPLTVAVRTRPGGNRERLPLEIQAGARLNGALVVQKSGEQWSIGRGRLAIGERAGPMPTQDGLHIAVRSASLNADEWWTVLRPGRGDRGDAGWLDSLSRLSVEADAVEVFGRPFGRLRTDVHKSASGWSGELEGEALAGRFSVAQPAGARATRSGASPVTIVLDLERLQLPPTGTAEGRSAVDPRDLPTVSVHSKSFRSGVRDFGALEFAAHPETDGWRIDKLHLQRPEAQATLAGMWRVDRFGQQFSRFDLQVTSSDFGGTLDGLGHPGEAAGGKLTLESQWSWPGAPAAFEVAHLSGEMSFKLSQGRLLKVEPGAGRVLGLFDIMTIPRYLTLDFSSLFGKGMVYNTIQSSLEVENGNAYTRNFTMDAAGATIDLSGRIGLAAQDLDLEMGVTPKLMEELAITGGLIGGPAVGAAVAVLHTLIKKPFEKSTRIPYTVRGSWQSPVVTRIGRPEPETSPTP